MKKISSERGALLVEILVAISIFAAIVGIAAQTLYVGVKGSTLAGQKDTGTRLLVELLEGVRGASEGSWIDLYALGKNGEHYHVALVSGRWVIVSGDEAITLSGATYMRYFTVANVSRDPSTHAIEATYLPLHDDPSLQQITAVVLQSGAPPLTLSQYVLRWRNRTCVQSDWLSSGSSGVKNCPDTAYVSATNITPGANLELCPGGC